MQKRRPDLVVMCVIRRLEENKQRSKNEDKKLISIRAKLQETKLRWEHAKAAEDMQPQPPIIRAKIVI